MTCEFCTRPNTHRYNATCLDCCVRLIDSARPSTQERDRMFAALDHFRRTLAVPTRRAIAARWREISETNSMNASAR